MAANNPTEKDRQDWLETLTAYHQQHLLQFWDRLTPSERQHLIEQLRDIDFDLMARLIAGNDEEIDWGALAARATSPPAIRLSDRTDQLQAEARQLGEEALRRGRVAVVIVAGGQGSRLGFPHPKGMYPIGPVSGRTLFQVLADRLRATARRFQTTIPLYLMTSPATHQETLEYLSENDYLGIQPQDVVVFRQGTMPAVDAESGKLLMESTHRLFLSPDGHGGMLAALQRSGALDDMERRGVEVLFYCQVDNPLVAVADPEFLGYHLRARSEMSTQVVAKRDPADKVGNVILVDGHTQVIEYSDLPDEAASRRAADGSLAIWAGSIAVHAMDVRFLRRTLGEADALPFHRAKKAVPHMDAHAQPIEPEEPNAIKFERFIFDLLPLAANAIVVEVDEREAFAPLKNAADAAKDTEATVKAAMVAQHRRWLEAVGCRVADGVQVEINPLFAYDISELARQLPASILVAEDRYFAQ